MGEKLKRFIKNMGVTFKQMGSSASKVLANLEKSEKEINEKMKKINSLWRCTESSFKGVSK